jgi:hypothetical protein
MPRSIAALDNRGTVYPQRNRDKTTFSNFTIGMEGLSRSLADAADVSFVMDSVKVEFGTLDLDKRVHLIPDAKVLILVPPEDDKLVLHKLDVDAVLEKSGLDYLFVTSKAPRYALAGKTLEYQVLARSRSGISFKLESGPKKMTITSGGRVVWQVEAGQAGTEVDALISIQNDAGQEFFHPFTVKVVDRLPAGVDLAAQPPEPVVKQRAKEKDPVVPAAVDRAIKRPTLAQDLTKLDLPEAIRLGVVGGGGRFLILHLPNARKLALFDVNEAKIVHHFPVEDGIKFAASADKLIVVTPSNILMCWNLFTRVREGGILAAQESCRGRSDGLRFQRPLAAVVSGQRVRGRATHFSRS